jgi:hypothetical protein
MGTKRGCASPASTGRNRLRSTEYILRNDLDQAQRRCYGHGRRQRTTGGSGRHGKAYVPWISLIASATDMGLEEALSRPRLRNSRTKALFQPKYSRPFFSERPPEAITSRSIKCSRRLKAAARSIRICCVDDGAPPQWAVSSSRTRFMSFASARHPSIICSRSGRECGPSLGIHRPGSQLVPCQARENPFLKVCVYRAQ